MSLHIRLNSKGGGGGGISSSGPVEGGGLSVAKSTGQNESVTVACPDHLILADLPVAKSLGVVAAASVRSVGRRSRRHLGERVHFCVSCDFPIAIYGRLSPCDHAFCLACARSEPSCYICDERIQKITAIKLSEAIHICAAPHCLKSFSNKPEFLEHVHANHSNLLGSNTEKGSQNDNNAPKQTSADAQKQSSVQPEMSTARAPPAVSTFSPGSNSQSQDREDRNRLQPRDSQPPRPNNWFPPPPAGPPPYMQNTDQFPSDNNKPSNNINPENSFSNFQNMPLPPHQPMNYQMPQTSHFPYNSNNSFPDNNMQQQQQQPMGMQMGVQFQQAMQMNNQGGMNMQCPYGNMISNNNNNQAAAAGMAYFQGMAMNPGLVNKENEQQQTGFGGVQATQSNNTVLQPPLPRQPPPPMPTLLVQQQQQIDRGRDFPPGFGWNDQRGKTD